jgi:hypothetical protein
MLTTIFAIASLATAAFAAPLEGRSPASPPSGSTILAPTGLYVFDVFTGAIGPKTTIAKVAKDKNPQIHEQTTLVTFTYPPETKNRQCALYFDFTAASWSGDSDKLAIFSSSKPNPATSAWVSGNQRDNQLGIWKKPTSSPAWADWESTYTGLSRPQPCQPGKTDVFEIVGQGTEAWVSFDSTLGGVRIAYW